VLMGLLSIIYILAGSVKGGEEKAAKAATTFAKDLYFVGSTSPLQLPSPPIFGLF
jgi:hypothetical protein